MRTFLMSLIGAAFLAVSLPAGAKERRPAALPVLQVPMVESPVVYMPIGQGVTVEIRSQRRNRWGELANVEREINNSLGMRLGSSLYGLNEEAWEGRMENLLRGAFSRVGMPVVLTHNDLNRWTAQRSAERRNSEVRQRSLPRAGTIERPQIVAVYDFTARYTQRRSPFAFPKAVFSTFVKVMPQLVVRLELADTAFMGGIFTIRGEIELSPMSRRPFVNWAAEQMVEQFAVLLAGEVNRTATEVAQRPGQVLSETTEGNVVLTLGRQNGVVEGSRIDIGGQEFHTFWVSNNLSVVSAQGLDLGHREALQKALQEKASVLFVPAGSGVTQPAADGCQPLVSVPTTAPPPPPAAIPPRSGGGGANGTTPIHGSVTRPRAVTWPKD